MEDWGKSSLLKGEFSIEKENSELINQYLSTGSRFSLWKDETNFTACQIEKVYNANGKIFPGETATIEFSAINSQVTLTLKKDDLVFFGVPYKRIGILKIEKVVSVDFNPVQ